MQTLIVDVKLTVWEACTRMLPVIVSVDRVRTETGTLKVQG